MPSQPKKKETGSKNLHLRYGMSDRSLWARDRTKSQSSDGASSTELGLPTTVPARPVFSKPTENVAQVSSTDPTNVMEASKESGQPSTAASDPRMNGGSK